VLNGTTQNALFEQLERSALKPLPADTYAEATWTQGLSDWIGSHTRTFAFIDGVPAMVVSDNAFEPTDRPKRQIVGSHPPAREPRAARSRL
jgi:transposase